MRAVQGGQQASWLGGRGFGSRCHQVGEGVCRKLWRAEVESCEGVSGGWDLYGIEGADIRVVELRAMTSSRVQAEHLSCEVVVDHGNRGAGFGEGEYRCGRADLGSDFFHDFATKARCQVSVVGLDGPSDGSAVGRAARPAALEEKELAGVREEYGVRFVTRLHGPDDTEEGTSPGVNSPLGRK